jgi:hypothetical protein
MANDDRTRDEAPEEKHPIDPPVREDERYRLDAERKERGSVTGGGRTGGDGSVQPQEFQRDPPEQTSADGRESDEPAVASKKSSLKTKS